MKQFVIGNLFYHVGNKYRGQSKGPRYNVKLSVLKARLQRDSGDNVLRANIKFREKGGTQQQFQEMVNRQQQNRRISQRQARGLGGGSKASSSTTATTQSARTAQGSGKQKFEQGYTVASKEKGYIAAKTGKRLTRAESIKSERQQAAEAQAAFTTTKQKIEAGRAAKAQALAEAKMPKTTAGQINENAQVITRMISPREQAEAISRGEVEPSFIGQFSAEKYYKSALSGSTAVPRPQDYFGPAYGITQKDLKEIRKEEQPKKKQGGVSKSPVETLGENLYYALRYSDLVDTGEEPKPKGVGLLPYYASRGLRPLYNIPLYLSGDKTIQPTTFSTAIDSIISPSTQQTKGVSGGTAGRRGYVKDVKPNPVIEFIKKAPLGAAIEAPAEIAMFIIGARIVQLAIRYSPIAIQSKRVLLQDDSIKTIYRGLTFKDKPVIGMQEGKLIRGYEPKKIPFTKIQTGSQVGGLRGAGELSKGTGIERELFYSKKTIDYQVSAGLITKAEGEKVKDVIKFIGVAMKAEAKTGSLGKLPIKNLTQEQSDYALSFVKQLQTGKRIEVAHGSISTRAHTPSFQQKTGSVLQMGDVDVSPIAPKFTILDKLRGKQPRTLQTEGEAIAKEFTEKFPLLKGQKLEITGLGGKSNIGVELVQGKSRIKIFESVLQEEKLSKYGISKGDKILGYRIPSKAVKTGEGIRVTHQDFQLLTNVKQVLSLQKGDKTPIRFYPDPGREKDIVRPYWLGKQKALDTSKTDLDKLAEIYRSRFPEIKFEGASLGKMTLLEKPISEPLSIGKGITTTPVRPTDILFTKEEPQIKSTKIGSLKSSISTKSAVSSIVKGSAITSSFKTSLASVKIPSYKQPSLKIKSPPSLKTLTSSRFPLSIKQPSIKNIPSVKQVSTKSTASIAPSPKSVTALSKIGSGKPSIKQPSIKTPLSVKPSSARPLPSIRPPSQRLGFPIKPTASVGGTVRITPTIIRIGPTRRIPPIIIPGWRSTYSLPKERPRKYTKPFLGNVHIEEITGFRTKYTDLDIGKKVERLAREDIRFTRKAKKLKRFVKEKKISLLSKSAQFFTPTKKQSKAFLKF